MQRLLHLRHPSAATPIPETPPLSPKRRRSPLARGQAGLSDPTARRQELWKHGEEKNAGIGSQRAKQLGLNQPKQQNLSEQQGNMEADHKKKVSDWMRLVMDRMDMTANQWAKAANTSPANITRVLKPG
jgi:D-serine deaminase-like pyridoxal phosphate-dependent protein